MSDPNDEHNEYYEYDDDSLMGQNQRLYEALLRLYLALCDALHLPALVKWLNWFLTRKT